ncbi:autotransporter assembly complex family protein [uncultured Thiothrix sp.]|uniref:autotransporter assembly complex protein TamA n=1 Tax=uncultured Thiothrix sp. TaxID=223185 RepID=UPI00260F97DA|nr:BamA/TamA family outer membrane protein [uncultured Thiothrix sp.]
MKLKPDNRLSVVVMATLLMSTASPAAEKEKKEPEASPVKVSIQGAEPSLEDNLRAYLPSLRNLKCESPAERIERYIDSAQSKLTKGAEAMGYFTAKFDMTSARQNNCWAFNIVVEPGPTVTVAKSNIRITGQGAQSDDFKEIASNPPYSNNEVLVTQKYEDFKSSLTRAASRLGYFDAQFVEREIQVNIDSRQAVVNLHFDTGKRYQFGQVDIEQDVLDQKFLKRYLRVEAGKDYNSEDLLRQQRLLENSGYYSDVQISSNYQKTEKNRVPVEIKALRNKRYAYTGKLAFASDDGFTIEGGMSARWVNRKGHKLDVALLYTQSGYLKTGFKYIVPLWQPEHEYAGIDVSWIKSKDSIDFAGIPLATYLDQRKLEFNYNRRTESDWQQTAFISFFEEKFRLVIDGDSIPDNTQLTLIGARVNKTKATDPLYPEKGWRVSGEIKGSHKSILSDETLLQARVDGKYLHNFDSGGKAIARGAVGATWVDTDSVMPKSLGFTTGGQDSVRGFDSNALGEFDEYGEVTGGKNLLVTSLEYEHPVTEKISAAVFADAGSAFDDWKNYDLHVGAGVGVRYKSPLGPVRLDLAVPKDNTKDLHFYFSLGPDL